MNTNGGTKQDKGFCERCGDANPYTVIVCGGCGARLPWATHGHRVTQHAPTAKVSKSAQNTSQPTPAAPSATNPPPNRVVTLAPGAAPHPIAPSTASSGLAYPTQANGNGSAAAWPQSGPLASSAPAAPAAPHQSSPVASSSVHMWVNPTPEQEKLSPCVVCGNVHVQRVRSICGAEQWPATGRAASPGHGHRWHRGGVPPVDAPTAAPGSAKAQLPRALAPPLAPTLERHKGIYGALTLALLGLVCLPITLTIRDYLPFLAHGLNALLFGSALVLFIISLSDARSARHTYQEQQAKWQRQMKHWSALLYCDRCDNVFHPAKGEATRVRNMNSLL